MKISDATLSLDMRWLPYLQTSMQFQSSNIPVCEDTGSICCSMGHQLSTAQHFTCNLKSHARRQIPG